MGGQKRRRGNVYIERAWHCIKYKAVVCSLFDSQGLASDSKICG